jgi:hypothetical protein
MQKVKRERFEMASRIRLKVGDVEVDFEGTEDFIKKEIPVLLAAMAKHAHTNGGGTPNTSSTSGATSNSGKLVGTTATLAGKLKVKSGTDLLVAAAARLTFVSNTPEFTRQQLLDEAKGASGYYKSSVSNNLTKLLNALVKSGDFLEPKRGSYALGANKKAELEKSLVS